MYRLSAVLLLAALALPSWAFYLRDRDRVVCYGDSITDSQWYPTLLETYILTRYPKWRVTFLNRGQSGDNTGSLKRFARDVVENRPTAVTFMMGYNDGGYQRLNPVGVDKFIGNVDESVQQVRMMNPRTRMMLLSSPPNECMVSTDKNWVSHEYYPYALLSYSDAEAKLAKKLQVDFVDITRQYGQTMGLGEVMAGSSFALSRDGVHPQEEGQTIIAYYALRGMNAEEILAETAIDAKDKGVIDTKNCRVRNLKVKNGIISFDRICKSLPYPTLPTARPFAFLTNSDDYINMDRLIVKKLAAPSYAISIDDKRIGEVSAAELAEGVNLSRYDNSSMMMQSYNVMAAVREKSLLDCRFWREFITTGKANGAGKPVKGISDDDAAAVMAAQAKIREAMAKCYTLNTPAKHTITMTPLDKKISPNSYLAEREFAKGFLDVSVSPMPINWNISRPTNANVTVIVSNPNPTEHKSQLEWQCPTGWQANPTTATVTVPGNGKVTVNFQVDRTVGSLSLAPLPVLRARWWWSDNWAYGLTKEIELPIKPTWTIAKARGPMTIDGDITREWDNATQFTLNDRTFVDTAITGKRATWMGPQDLSATVKAQWDDTALYLAVDVADDEHLQEAEPSMMWSEDMLQFAAYMQDPKKPVGRYEFGFAAYRDKDDMADYSSTRAPAGSDPIRFATGRPSAPGHCTYEVAIPWTRLAPFVPQPGKSFLSTVVIGDRDSQPGKGYTYLAWTPGIAYGKNPFDMATIVLGE